MTVTVGADIFTSDRLSTGAFTDSAGSVPATSTTSQLGPIFNASWQFRVAATGLRELTFFVADRYRTRYSLDRVSIDGSSGDYLDSGVHTLIPIAHASDVLADGFFRYQTGLSSDNSIATAGERAGGVTLGLSQRLGADFVLMPFVRGQIGTLESAGVTVPAHGLSGGVSLTERF
jgi:hypothetical protein